MAYLPGSVDTPSGKCNISNRTFPDFFPPRSVYNDFRRMRRTRGSGEGGGVRGSMGGASKVIHTEVQLCTFNHRYIVL